MRIKVLKYEWPVGTEDNEVNFFSDEIARVGSEIDLFDFMVQGSFSGISYDMQDIDEKDNTLYVKASQCSFDCLNTSPYNTTTLTEYFQLYTISHLTKWKAWIYDDNDTEIYRGIIYKDAIELDEVESQILSIKIIGEEKEFSDYFKNKTLVGTDQIEEANLPLAVNLDGLKWYSLHRVLKANFPGVQFDFMFDLTHMVSLYYVVDKPYIYSPKIGFPFGLLKFRAGYDSFVLMQVDPFAWFNSLCLCEGWKWLFKDGILYIRNAYDISLDEVAYDYNETFLTHSISPDVNQFAIDNVLMPDGGYFSDDNSTEIYTLNISSNQDGYRYIGGNRDIFFSEKNDYENNLRPFHHLTNVGINNALYRYYFNNYFTNFQEEEWTWAYRNKKFEMYNVNFLNHYDTNERFLNFKKNNTLNINPVVCSADYGGTLDMTQARVSTGAFYGNGNAYRVNHEVGNHGFWFTGSVGHCVAKYNASPQGYYCYEDRIKQSQWKDNMRTYLSANASLPMNIEVYDCQTNPLVYLTISNYDWGDIGGKALNVLGINFNPITNRTNYKVVITTV